MKNYNNMYRLLIVLSLIMVSCGGSGDDNSGGGEVASPEKATLVYPDNNEECTGGVVISNTKAKLEFVWDKADNATSYTLYVKNLSTNNTEEFSSISEKREITIDRATPYSWYVVSNSSKTNVTATSDTWQFYLAGAGIENYAPFPAELKLPANEAAITTTTVNLEWSGSDVDNDVKEYDVYLDTNASPTTKVTTTSNQKLDNQSVTAGNTYYWKIVTHDDHGNTSTSQVYSFTVN